MNDTSIIDPAIKGKPLTNQRDASGIVAAEGQLAVALQEWRDAGVSVEIVTTCILRLIVERERFAAGAAEEMAACRHGCVDGYGVCKDCGCRTNWRAEKTTGEKDGRHGS